MRNVRVNIGRVVHETIDDEAIVIDLETGTYYSLRGTAMALWPALVEGVDVDALTAVAAREWGEDPVALGSAIGSFVDELRADEVLVAADGTDDAAAVLGPLVAEYAPPELTKYTNMSDLLMLDPIHDVDEQGWPNAES